MWRMTESDVYPCFVMGHLTFPIFSKLFSFQSGEGVTQFTTDNFTNTVDYFVAELGHLSLLWKY